MVMTITAILAVSGIASAVHLSAARQDGAVDTIVAHLRYLQTLAMTTQNRTWMVFDTINHAYTAYQEDPDSPGRTDRVIATNPADRKAFTIDLADSGFQGITFSSVRIGGGREVGFDGLGTPYNSSETALTEDGAITLSGGQAIVITCETGFVHRQDE